ncbi:armadillo-like helical domain-containing protein 4 [Acipenser ruthenus]|uniref:armadillo-like helical domain-containing protein 4 n=1 Tax=Acipenser ruthenus TaxID=7906 RepID=UPI0027427C96|nr:armadillo-like helical domain-containing protein 4 [Acipenser ruthenus]XP_058846533.1 armadillo-like helical domain-containing protein 4 [Acipenser ruthenus]XP_058846534.1 armadillo-like helical domain-containing protein 4 [Acipenser ruthenus]
MVSPAALCVCLLAWGLGLGSTTPVPERGAAPCSPTSFQGETSSPVTGLELASPADKGNETGERREEKKCLRSTAASPPAPILGTGFGVLSRNPLQSVLVVSTPEESEQPGTVQLRSGNPSLSAVELTALPGDVARIPSSPSPVAMGTTNRTPLVNQTPEREGAAQHGLELLSGSKNAKRRAGGEKGERGKGDGVTEKLPAPGRSTIAGPARGIDGGMTESRLLSWGQRLNIKAGGAPSEVVGGNQAWGLNPTGLGTASIPSSIMEAATTGAVKPSAVTASQHPLMRGPVEPNWGTARQAGAVQQGADSTQRGGEMEDGIRASPEHPGKTEEEEEEGPGDRESDRELLPKPRKTGKSERLRGGTAERHKERAGLAEEVPGARDTQTDGVQRGWKSEESRAGLRNSTLLKIQPTPDETKSSQTGSAVRPQYPGVSGVKDTWHSQGFLGEPGISLTHSPEGGLISSSAPSPNPTVSHPGTGGPTLQEADSSALYSVTESHQTSAAELLSSSTQDPLTAAETATHSSREPTVAENEGTTVTLPPEGAPLPSEPFVSVPREGTPLVSESTITVPPEDILSQSPDSVPLEEILPPSPDSVPLEEILPPSPDSVPPEDILPPSPDSVPPEEILPPSPDSVPPEEILSPSPDSVPPEEILSQSPDSVPLEEILPPSPDSVPPEEILPPSPDSVPPEEILSPSPDSVPLEEILPPSPDSVPPEEILSPSPDSVPPEEILSQSPDSVPPEEILSQSPDSVPPEEILSPSPDSVPPEEILPPSPDSVPPEEILPQSPDSVPPEEILPPSPDSVPPEEILPPSPDSVPPEEILSPSPDSVPPEGAPLVPGWSDAADDLDEVPPLLSETLPPGIFNISETPPPGPLKSSETPPHGTFRNPKTALSGTFGNPETPPSRIFTSETPPLTTRLPPTSVTMATSLMWPPAEAGLDDLEKLESEEDREDNVSEDEDEEEEEESPDSDEAESVEESEPPEVSTTTPSHSHTPFHLPEGSEWAQRNQGLVRSWVEKIRDKAGYVSGMLAPVGIGIVGALFILGALYSIKVMHRKRRSGFKRQRRKHGEMSNRQDRVMLLADSSEDEF